MEIVSYLIKKLIFIYFSKLVVIYSSSLCRTNTLKITNKFENHHEYQYKSGLNVMKNFDEKSQQSGFYFATRNNIHHFYDMGLFISPIILPKNDTDFKMFSTSLSHRSNKIILGEKHSLAEIETYKKFNIPFPTLTQVLYNKYYNLIPYIGIENDENHLIYCMEKNIPDIVEKLINRGINIYIGNRYILKWSLKYKYWKIIRLLIEKDIYLGKEADTILYLAVKNGDLDTIIKLINRGIYIDQSKALITSAEQGHLQIVKFLITQGADVNTNVGFPLIQSAKYGHLEIVKFLVEQGAIININNNYAIKWAAQYGHLEIVKYLVSMGANFEVNNNCAFRLATESGHTQVVEYLVSISKKIKTNNCYSRYFCQWIKKIIFNMSKFI